jgi:hypothetical protein
MTPLEDLLATLDTAGEVGAAPVWVQAYGRPADKILAVDEVMDRMFGWRPPVACWAVGVVAEGWAFPPEQPAPAPRRRQRVQTRILVGSDGEVASRVRMADGRLMSDVPAGGRLLDALQRCLGLPTAPPTRPSSEIIGLVWAAEIMAVGARRPGRQGALGWAEVAALHPAVRALAEDGHAVDADHAEQVMAAANRLWTWSRLRQLAASGSSWLSEMIRPDLAEWMDDGIFSRWLLYDAKPWSDVLPVATGLLSPAVARRLARCLADSGVDESRLGVSPNPHWGSLKS